MSAVSLMVCDGKWNRRGGRGGEEWHKGRSPSVGVTGGGGGGAGIPNRHLKGGFRAS